MSSFNAGSSLDFNNPIIERERKRKQSLIYTLRRGYFTQARLLLENNEANPNEIYRSTDNSITTITPIINNGSSSITNASQNNPLSVITNLTQVINSAYALDGRTPLMFCSLIEDDTWSYGIAQNLIEKGAKIGYKDPNGLNALMYACMHQRKNLVNLYLNALGDYSLLAIDNFGNTAMHIASLGRSQDICITLCNILVKYDINPLKDIPKNKFGHKPHEICAANGHTKCIENYYLVNERFINKLNNNKIAASNRIKSAYKREISFGPNSLQRLTSTDTPNSNSALSDYAYRAQTAAPQLNGNYNNFNCPSILFERSETNISPNVPPIQKSITPDTSRALATNKTDSNKFISTATTITPTQNSAVSSTCSIIQQTIPSSSHTTSTGLEIYKYIYSYKEALIKTSVIDTNSNKGKPRFKSSNSNRSFRIETDKQQSNESDRLLKSAKPALVVIDKSDKIDNRIYRIKSASTNKLSSVIQQQQQQPKQQEVHKEEEPSTWRKQVNHLFSSLELQTCDSYRKSFPYTATTLEQLQVAGFQTVNSLNNNNNNNFNRRSSLNTRRSIVATNVNGTFTARKQSVVTNLVVNMKPQTASSTGFTTRRTSVMMNA